MNVNNQIETTITSIPIGWQEVKLGDVLERITKGTTPNGFSNNQNDINYVKSESLSYEGNLDYSKFVKITEFQNNQLKRSQLKENDILLSMAGAYLGKSGLVKNEILPANTNQAVAILSVNSKVNYVFLWFKLRSKEAISFFNSIPSQSAQPNINFEEIKSFAFPLPPLHEQQAIAAILSSLDDKIELLRDQNKTLEELGQKLFESWFNKYLPNDTLPEGWKVFILDEILTSINGYSYKGVELVESSNEALVTLKNINRTGGFQSRGFKPFNGTAKKEQEVVVGDLIVAHTDLTQDAEVLGNPAFVYEDGGYNKLIITMDLVKVVPKIDNVSSSFIYFLMLDRRFKGHCVGYSNGTTVLHLSKKAIPTYEIALPINMDLVIKFSKIATSLTSKLSNNLVQIQTLSKTRDTLLPQLMSGEVRVGV